jgi:pyrimidine-nucleoside phosphorylase
MRAVDIIMKKRNGAVLSREELSFMISGYISESIPEYQISALLMAIYFQGMSPEEIGTLTDLMIHSGETMKLTAIPRPYVDKHSTGGVGDKVSLILAPLAAACGVSVPMMSGRSLGHTGGTLDKLDAIPGFRTALSPGEFAEIIDSCGYAMTGQSRDVVPADRLLYALRDVTGTVESVPLITSSILSKKFAEGADALIFDVKSGSGAFMKSVEEAHGLAQSLVRTGSALGKKIVAVQTAMDVPLGERVGNFLEIEETLALLGAPAAREHTPFSRLGEDLREVTLRLTAWMLVVAGIVATPEEGESRCLEALENGSALKKWEQNVRLQGGDLAAMYKMVGTHRAPIHHTIIAEKSGTLQQLDAWHVGMGAVYLGAGRSTAADAVRSDVGFRVLHKPGDTVQKGEGIIEMWGVTDDDVQRATATVTEGIVIGSNPVHRVAMIQEELTAL